MPIDYARTGMELVCDAIAGTASAFLVSPFVTVIDRSIIKQANGSEAFWVGMRKGFYELFTTPWRTVSRRDFLIVWGLYAGTYVAANCIETTMKAIGKDPELPKFFGAAAVNIFLCVRKDVIFTKIFSNVPIYRAYPTSSYLLFAIRDSMTVASAFNLPKLLSGKEAVTPEEKKKEKAIQVATPIITQILSAPIHLLALDLYNFKSSTSFARIARMTTNFPVTVAGRVARIGPAFGIGGIGNTEFRRELKRFTGTLSSPIPLIEKNL